MRHDHDVLCPVDPHRIVEMEKVGAMGKGGLCVWGGGAMGKGGVCVCGGGGAMGTCTHTHMHTVIAAQHSAHTLTCTQ